jgi:hypothetical protein
MDMLLDLSGSSGPAKPASSSLLMDDLLSLGGMGAPMAPAAARPAAAAPMLDLLGGFGGGGSMAPGGRAPAMPMMPVMGFGGAPPMLAPETLPPALVAHIGNHPKSHEKAQLLMEDANLRVSYYKVSARPCLAALCGAPSHASAIDRADPRAREAVGGRMRSSHFGRGARCTAFAPASASVRGQLEWLHCESLTSVSAGSVSRCGGLKRR